MSPRNSEQFEPIALPQSDSVDFGVLPEGWAWARLHELKGRNGIFTDGDWILAEHLKTGTDVRLIQLADIGVLHFANKSSKFISSATAESLRVTFLKENDVLISRMAHPLARACLMPKPCKPSITAVDVAVIRCDGTIGLSKYIMFVCNTNAVLNQAEVVAVGTTRKRISRKNLEQIIVPLPPLAEQRRIVAKLEELLGKVSSSQQRLSRVPGLLKRFRQSVLAAACSGRLTADWREENAPTRQDEPTSSYDPRNLTELPESWRWTTLESVCEKIVDCPHSTPKWTDTGKLCIRTTNFRPGNLDLTEVRFVSTETFNERIERLRPASGDIVYSREGGILGIACQIPIGVELCLGQRMMLFRVGADYVATMLMHWLNSPYITKRVQELTGGSASPHLNVRDIKAFPVPLPELAEQQEIVRRVEKLFAFADQIEARLKHAQEHVDRLTQSILAKAFRGELVPTEAELARREVRNYETASQLLARIQATQATNSQLKPKRKKAIEK